MTLNKKILTGIAVLLACLILYKYSPYKIEFLGYYDKIWAHRVNSKEKLNSALNFYSGVELDLVYNSEKNIFDVNHPPVKSINLTFEEYLSEINKDKNPGIWLDIKNLNKDNSRLIFNRLIKIFDAINYNIENVLVETRYPEALPLFTEKGFITSYYLPSNLRNKKTVALASEIQKINKVLLKQPNIGISTNYKDYLVLQEYFPKKDKYLWMTTSITERWFQKTRSILKDEKVKVVLVSYNAIYGNR